MYLKEKKNEKESSFYETTRAWTEETDNLFFSKRNRGLVSWLIPTGSTIYYEFEGGHSISVSLDTPTKPAAGFYLKLKSSVCDGKTLLTPTQADRMKIVRQEGEMIRHTLVLFQDFQNKKREGLKKKIEETKAALPVTPFANAIVQTLKQHRILLIAGDTGCGKSTQGEWIWQEISREDLTGLY